MKSEITRIIFNGALAGAMLTVAMIALFFAGWQLAGLPFVPFDVFDWLARVLPGNGFPLRPGEHKITVRCYDWNGIPQIVGSGPPDPSGATGLFSKKQPI